MITVGTLFVNACPPVTVTAFPFHSKIPYFVKAVSNQNVPFAGAAAGALELGEISFRSMSALVTKALFATPKKE